MNINLAYNAQVGIETKTFISPLSRYTQSNCQVTLTDDGYYIHRPPNLNQTDNGSTMYGGFILRYSSPPFTKGHTYIIAFNVKGRTSAAPSNVYWSNNAGWGGHGLSPSPSNVQQNSLGANWQSNNWYPYYYKFTINDDVYKVCTSSYSSFVEGQTYPSYRDFLWGFSYSATGEWGTDLYINNVRLYDITNGQKISINKQGQLLANGIIESPRKLTSFLNTEEVLTDNFYEY